MCFAYDAAPPDLPADRVRAPLAGGAGVERMTLTATDGTPFSVALAESPAPAGPAVLVLPDVRGLYGFYEELAERFAQAGHHALVLDLFGRTAGLGPRDGDFEYLPHVRATTAEGVLGDAAVAVAALRERTGTQEVVSVGFCFGGSWSYLAANDATLDLTGAVAFYGGLDRSAWGLPSPKEHGAEARCPVLGLFGGADESIPPADRAELEAGLAASGQPYELHVYEGAPHAFFDRAAAEHADASADAWRRTLDFVAGQHVDAPA